MMKNAHVDNETKVITMIQRNFENLSPEDAALLERYQKFGYTVKVEDNPKRKAREEDLITEEALMEILGDDDTAKDKYEQIKADSGFFAARSWVLKEYKATK